MPKSWVVQATRNGQGLVAVRRVRPGERITDIVGRRVSAETVWNVGGALSNNSFRYGPETYLDPGEGPGRWLNHSCEPNAAIGKRGHQLYLFAVAPIRAGQEIVMDYSTILATDDIWTMRCRCGSGSCRKVARNLRTLPADLLQDYLRRGMVPEFIRRASPEL